jgi:protein-S-isoprenylcysteine O-methyltransferase Ste14
MWGLLVAAWMLGIVVTYLIVTQTMKSRDEERGVD